MRRKLTVALLLLACFLLQSTVFKALALGNASPNLLVVLVSSIGFMRGRTEGMWTGFFAGLLVDLFFGSYLGFYTLLYMYVGYVNGMFRKGFYPEDVKLPMLLISLSDLVLNFMVYLLLFMMRGDFRLSYYFLHIMVPELIYTILVTIVLYFLILKINQRLEAVEKRSAAKFV